MGEQYRYKVTGSGDVHNCQNAKGGHKRMPKVFPIAIEQGQQQAKQRGVKQNTKGARIRIPTADDAGICGPSVELKKL